MPGWCAPFMITSSSDPRPSATRPSPRGRSRERPVSRPTPTAATTAPRGCASRSPLPASAASPAATAVPRLKSARRWKCRSRRRLATCRCVCPRSVTAHPAAAVHSAEPMRRTVSRLTPGLSVLPRASPTRVEPRPAREDEAAGSRAAGTIASRPRVTAAAESGLGSQDQTDNWVPRLCLRRRSG